MRISDDVNRLSKSEYADTSHRRDIAFETLVKKNNVEQLIDIFKRKYGNDIRKVIGHFENFLVRRSDALESTKTKLRTAIRILKDDLERILAFGG